MATPVIMPRQGQSVESCVLAKWAKKVGDTVAVGDLLFSYETDKSGFEEEAKVAGTLLAVFAQEGDDVPCLNNVAVIGNPGESFAEFAPAGAAPVAAEAPAAPAAAPAVAAPVAPAAAPAASASNAVPVIMPRQGQSVESCVLAKWAKKVGDTVAVGDLLFSYETDKAGFEEEAKVAGTLLAIFFQEGDDVPCLTNVAVIGTPGDSFAEFAPANASVAPAAAPAPAAAAAVEAAPAAVEVPAVANENVFASPRARAAAKKAGVDLRFATPTGPNGRVIERDVDAMRAAGIGLITSAAKAAGLEGAAGAGIGGRMTTAGAPVAAAPAAPVAAPAAAPAAPAPAAAPAAAPVAAAEAEFEDVKIPNIRKVISRAMHASLSEMAQLTYNTSFDASQVMGYRAKVKANMERLGLENITLNDIILFAVSRTLANPEFKDINANFLNGDTMRYFKHVNLGVAVDTPRGLMVPTIFNADTKSLNQIAAEVKDLAKQCKGGAINPDLLKGASFTVSNLGNMGIESFTPVINPPQTSILGVCAVEPKVRAGKDGSIELYQAMGLSLTCDHRVIDGTPSAKFLKALCQNLENFDILLCK